MADDSEDVCMELPDISPSSILEIKQKLEKKDSGFHTMSFRNTNYMSAEEEAVGSKAYDNHEDQEMSLATRRQSHQDGSSTEHQSLLGSRRASFPAVPSRWHYQMEDVELDSFQASSGPCHFKTLTCNKVDRSKRINILKKELSRIQTELKSLGELECEVSFV